MSERKQAKRWFLTWPRSDGLEREMIAEKLREIGPVREMIVAKENHTDEGKHHHAYVEYEEQLSWRARAEPNKWDVEGHHPNVQTVRNRKKTVEYVTKEDKTPLVNGIDLEAVKGKKRSYASLYEMELDDLKEEVHPKDLGRTIGGIQLYKLMKQQARETEGCKGIWIRGAPGSGKSHLVETTFPNAYRKAQNKWWDGYRGEEIVILEDLDGPYLNHYLKIWGDKWRCTGEVKGAVVPLMHKWIIVTSNYTIREIVEMGTKGDRVDFTMIEAIERRFEEVILERREDYEEALEKVKKLTEEEEREEEPTEEPPRKRRPE